MPDPVALLHVPALSDVAEYAATIDSPARLVFTAGACPLVAVLGYTDQLTEVEAVAAVRMAV
ncbi:hypothetical protein JNW91_07695 [Micromonospora sp. STR1_7]|uniref:Uncharacterized protein n=1 Tax=Micromonospora parastrephiae TaxID=2806101 RepID=A0ABS1XR68_9ACTN|nr:hypothetical protein [Micromonospora parastrephiae]MBM0231751.1 hypothetical protein [Micromonospora parastrephiae]